MPTIGPFLENLVKSVDGWLNNSIEVNLALCSIISRLATYPHPLLRSLILNPYLILQPSIPCLAVSIATLKQRIDSTLRVHENQEMLMEEAKFLMQARLTRVAKRDSSSNPNNNKGKLHLENNCFCSKVIVYSFCTETKPKSSKFAGIFGSLVRKDLTAESIKEEDFENGHR